MGEKRVERGTMPDARMLLSQGVLLIRVYFCIPQRGVKTRTTTRAMANKHTQATAAGMFIDRNGSPLEALTTKQLGMTTGVPRLIVDKLYQHGQK